MAFGFIDEYPAVITDGVCFTCYAPRRDNERLINTDRIYDVVEDGEGTVHYYKVAVICETCVQEMADLIGCWSKRKARMLENRLCKAEDERDAYRNKIDELAAKLVEAP